MAFAPVSGVGRSTSINTSALTAISAATSVLSVASMFTGPKWGIFDQYGTPLLVSDAVAAVAGRNEWNTPTYPLEQGGFANYNKVRMPFESRIVFMNSGQKPIDGQGGILTTLIPGLGLVSLVGSLFGVGTLQASRRAQFMDRLYRLANDLDPVVVVMPEFVMRSATIVQYDWQRDREGGGASLIPIEVSVREVVISTGTTTKTTNDTKNPASQDAKPQGTVTSKPATTAQTKAAPALPEVIST